MTLEQKQAILPLLDQYWKLDLEKRIAEVYKDAPDLAAVNIGNYTAIEFYEFSKKAISQVGQTLQSKLFAILPYTYDFRNEFGSGSLRDDLSTFITTCETNSFEAAVGYLYRIVYYLVNNGIWEKEQPVDKKKKDQVVQELEGKLILIAEKLDLNLEINNKLVTELNEEKTKISTLTTAKTQELSEITSLLTNSRAHSEEITRLLTTSTDSNQQITGLINQQNSSLQTLKQRSNEESEIFTLLLKQIKELKDSYITAIGEAEKTSNASSDHLNTVVEKSKAFDERLLVLDELIGKEGALKLFSTFSDRKNELSKPIRNWSIIVFATGIAVMFYILCVFTNFFGQVGGFPKEIDWHYLIINSIKSVPAIIVLYFAIRQYVKERTYQEEYAFRSAIALTVQAYADIAGTKKEELIAKAVENIYNTPSMMKDGAGLLNFNSRQLSKTLKELNETIKTLKS